MILLVKGENQISCYYHYSIQNLSCVVTLCSCTSPNPLAIKDEFC